MRRFHTKEPDNKPYNFSCTYFLLFLFSIIVTAWGYIFYWQEAGYHLCKSIFVQFDDEFIPAKGIFIGVYYQVKQVWGIEKKFAKTQNWEILYCDSKNVWASYCGGDITNRPEY